jgi:hypothetical protein
MPADLPAGRVRVVGAKDDRHTTADTTAILGVPRGAAAADRRRRLG